MGWGGAGVMCSWEAGPLLQARRRGDVVTLPTVMEEAGGQEGTTWPTGGLWWRLR